jgi:hypothetical protein
LAQAGNLTLSQSAHEYAVYDAVNTFGRWPVTAEGYSYAFQTYEAHRQSVAHGIAYSATGYQDPARLGLPTEAKIKSKSYAAPLSYVGSTRRIVSWASGTERRSPAFAVLTWVLASIALVLVWTFLLIWYVIIFGLFGVFVIPYRLVRRSQRKSTHVQQTSLATQQAMLQQMSVQQQILAQQIQGQQQPYPQPVLYPQPGVLQPGPYRQPSAFPPGATPQARAYQPLDPPANPDQHR